VESVEGQELIDASFPGGANAPTDIVVADPERAGAVAAAVRQVDGVADVRPAIESGDGVLLNAILENDPYDKDTFAIVPDIREAAHGAGGEGTLVGGATAVEYDVREANKHDAKLIVPLTLLVVLVVLILLLRALVAPLILTATVILSFAASLGVGFVVFDVIFGFPGSSPDLALFAFVFLVALGIDYNIFLMARVREEAQRHGAREGMLRGLAVTGGVITSAGVVLAGTFLVLAVLPLVFLTEIGFVVAFGVLLDTLVVRSILVPALVFDIGAKIWWPSTLASSIDHRAARRHVPADEPAG
jgi:RND superfamily putative drug exporter